MRILFLLVLVGISACALQKNDSASIKFHDNKIVFLGNFDGGYNNSTWSTNWGIEYVDRANGGRLIKSDLNNGMALRVEYPEGGIGPKESGVSFPIVFRNISNVEQGLFNELYIRYYVKFEKGFDFRLGGKLPGIMGGGDSWTRSGGQQPDGSNGWTLRFMWREGGEIVIYAYLPKSQNGKWGRKEWGQDITTGVYSTPGQWYCIEQYVNIGTPGKDDGVLKVWINNELKIFIDDLRFWDVENNFGKIGGIYFSTFHGGNTKDWAPRITSFAQFDEFAASKVRIGGIK